MTEASSVYHSRSCGSACIVRDGRNRCGSRVVPAPRLREQQGSRPEGAPQRGAQVRGAADLSGRSLAAGAERAYRHPTQHEHRMAEKNSGPAAHRGDHAPCGGGNILEIDEMWNPRAGTERSAGSGSPRAAGRGRRARQRGRGRRSCRLLHKESPRRLPEMPELQLKRHR